MSIPYISRRRFLQTTTAVGAAATTGAFAGLGSAHAAAAAPGGETA
ncbi:twin-arginine translocation signal domain-containing protein, partial [Streptomyces sp. SID10115]|nr:twin-arginine translocation signal domain-containing protein [Streptomyces sp. SID10115]